MAASDLMRREFARLYPVMKNGTQAAIAAGYSKRSAVQQASKLLIRDDVQGWIAEREKQLDADRDLTKVDVSKMWKEAATVDRNELMEVRRTSCRYCWGRENRYQETPEEHRRRKAAHDALLAATPEKDWVRISQFDELGGVGFKGNRDPNPDCPECFGDGDMRVIIKDTRKLSPAARSLYEGVKITKDGVELKVVDRAKAIERLGESLGMFRGDPRRGVQLGEDGLPMAVAPVVFNLIAVKVVGGEGS